MAALEFDRDDAEEAILRTQKFGVGWLYEKYPKPGGKMRKSTTGFIVHEGSIYPVKPLGRLASEIAGRPMTENPITNYFRAHFQNLGFQLVQNVDEEAVSAAERQRRLSEEWARPEQAQFRKRVFDLYGRKCIISNCQTFEAIEAAHIVPVASGGGDDACNGLPLRADLHRLFDAGLLTIDCESWVVNICCAVINDYRSFEGTSIASRVKATTKEKRIAEAFTQKA